MYTISSYTRGAGGATITTNNNKTRGDQRLHTGMQNGGLGEISSHTRTLGRMRKAAPRSPEGRLPVAWFTRNHRLLRCRRNHGRCSHLKLTKIQYVLSLLNLSFSINQTRNTTHSEPVRNTVLRLRETAHPCFETAPTAADSSPDTAVVAAAALLHPLLGAPAVVQPSPAADHRNRCVADDTVHSEH